jgi:hypothetical protein
MPGPNPKTSPEAISSSLEARRERIARLLRIDPNDQEWQQGAEAQPRGSNLSAVQWMVEQRKRGSSKGCLVARIDLALEEIGGALHLYVLLWDAMNRGPGIGAVRAALQDMAADPTPYVNGARDIDHVTLAWLDSSYPGGWMALETAAPDGLALQQAAQQALANLPAPARGRPAGRQDVAARAVAPRLAQIYGAYAERNPTRRVEIGSGRDYGPLKEFVIEVMSVLPDECRMSAKGGLKSVDHIVRLGVSSLTRNPPPSDQLTSS